MKLNNRGWGLKQMLIISSVLLILLLLVAYYIYVLYNKLDTREGKDYYKLETKLEVAAIKYSANMHSTMGRVTLSELKSLGYIDSFTDENGYSCDGYVVYEDDRYDTYITCPDFTTKNYEKNMK